MYSTNSSVGLRSAALCGECRAGLRAKTETRGGATCCAVCCMVNPYEVRAVQYTVLYNSIRAGVIAQSGQQFQYLVY